jgi:hypothetical protein
MVKEHSGQINVIPGPVAPEFIAVIEFVRILVKEPGEGKGYTKEEVKEPMAGDRSFLQ